jgi:predicted alpha-1,6-mannanase (GH76 family)
MYEREGRATEARPHFEMRQNTTAPRARTSSPKVLRRTLLVAALVASLAGVLAGCGAGRPTEASASSRPGASGSEAPVVAPPTQAAAAGAGQAMRRAAAAYDAFERAFYSSTGTRAKYTESPGTGSSPGAGTAVFWRQAELIEMTEDAYLASHSPALKAQVVTLMNGVRYQYGRTWARRTWNDDIEWMIIAAVRAYQITGNRVYLGMAQKNWDVVYARAYSPDLGGGLWWITGGTGRLQKNVTTNATAIIAAALLARSTHDQAYLAKAEQLYAWLRATLYDPRTGAVYDSVSPAKSGSGTVVNKAALTYNQGTFTGAAGLLYQATHRAQYKADALKAIAYTRDVMSHGGLLPAEAGGNGNLLGFKGIFARWALEFLRAEHISTFDPWFKLNADAAWRHRDGRGLIGPDWSQTTPATGLDSWGASSAVVLLEDLAR